MNVFFFEFENIILEISTENDKLRGINFVNSIYEKKGFINKFELKVLKELKEYFEGKRKRFSIEYELQGTEFQKKVWKVLENISYGEHLSYGEVAEKIGNSKASRAVGMACNKNKIPIIIPCHRVVGKNGKLVGFAGGLSVKETLLTLEKGEK